MYYFETPGGGKNSGKPEYWEVFQNVGVNIIVVWLLLLLSWAGYSISLYFSSILPSYPRLLYSILGVRAAQPLTVIGGICLTSFSKEPQRTINKRQSRSHSSPTSGHWPLPVSPPLSCPLTDWMHIALCHWQLLEYFKWGTLWMFYVVWRLSLMLLIMPLNCPLEDKHSILIEWLNREERSKNCRQCFQVMAHL